MKQFYSQSEATLSANGRCPKLKQTNREKEIATLGGWGIKKKKNRAHTYNWPPSLFLHSLQFQLFSPDSSPGEPKARGDKVAPVFTWSLSTEWNSLWPPIVLANFEMRKWEKQMEYRKLSFSESGLILYYLIAVLTAVIHNLPKRVEKKTQKL